MSKKVTKLTLESLIAKKLERDKTQVNIKEIEVPSLRGSLPFHKPADEDIFDAFDKMKGQEEDLRVMDEVFIKLIYRCCPMLRDDSLKEQFGVKDHIGIVPALFSLADRMTIGKELMVMSGLAGEEVAENIKK